MSSLQQYFQRRYESIMLPIVRVKAQKATGTGTAIYSLPNGNGGYSTFVLTNYHVVEDNITRESEWSDILQDEKKYDQRQMVEVEFFFYRWSQRTAGGNARQADIVTYDPKHDFALLKVRSDEKRVAARLYPRGQESWAWLRPGMPVICVGCGLGEEPVQTEGILSRFGKEINFVEFWLNSSPSIFGNSGGALFLGDVGRRFPDDECAVEQQFALIGVPSLIGVTWLGDAITHLSYSAPIDRIYQFLEKKYHRFIYDQENHTEESEEVERKRLREKHEKELATK